MARGDLTGATDIVKAGRQLARSQQMEVRVVGLVQDPADRLVLGTLLSAHTQAGISSVKTLGLKSAADVSEADLAVVVVRDPAAPNVEDHVAAVAARRRHAIVVVPGAGEEAESRLAALLGVRADQVVPSPDGELLPGAVAAKAVKMVGERRFALAAAFPVFRAAAAAEVVSATAWQNAAVATVLGVPGADMPVLTANQIKMVLRIAAVHGESIGFERAKEILAVIAGGLTFRTIARQALGLVPGPGWLIKGGIAYSGTVAIGKAAERYFALGPEGRRGLAARLRRRAAG